MALSNYRLAKFDLVILVGKQPLDSAPAHRTLIQASPPIRNYATDVAVLIGFPAKHASSAANFKLNSMLEVVRYIHTLYNYNFEIFIENKVDKPGIENSIRKHYFMESKQFSDGLGLRKTQNDISHVQPDGLRVPAQDTASSLGKYQYKTLPTNTSIRLLEILPHPGEQIYCTLQTQNLEADPDFDALSYSWTNPITIREEELPQGDEGEKILKSFLFPSKLLITENRTLQHIDFDAFQYFNYHNFLPYEDIDRSSDRCCEIFCDGLRILVTKSLYEALIQLRKAIILRHEAEKSGGTYMEPFSRSKYLWIDAICINQNDVDERNGQVPLMGRIYRSAQTVIAWLGEKDSLGQLGFTALANLNTILENDPLFRRNFTSIYSVLPSLNLAHWLALTALFSRLWFRRAWVVQEAVFARRLYVFCGSFTTDWWALTPAIEFIKEKALEVELAELVSSLLNRQPLAKFAQKERLENMTGNDFATSSKRHEVERNIMAAVKFMTGVIELKGKLGMPCYQLGQSFEATDEEVDSPGLDEKARAVIPNQASVQVSNAEDEQENNVLDAAAEVPASALPSSPENESTDDASSTRQLNELVLEENTNNSIESETQGLEQMWTHRILSRSTFKRRSTAIQGPVSFFSLVTGFRDVGATDPRDKIFGFLNIASEEDANVTPLRANYRMSIEDVFIGTTSVLLSTNHLCILSHVQDKSHTRVPTLPSWVPDFSVPLGKSSFVDSPNKCPYSASGTSRQPCLYTAKTNENKLILLLHGFMIDTVTEVARDGGCYFARVADIALKTPSIYPKGKKGKVYLDSNGTKLPPEDSDSVGRSRVEALWRTMIGDFSENTYPAPTSAGFGFSDWLANHLIQAESWHIMLHHHSLAVGDTMGENLKVSKEKQVAKFDKWKALAADEYGRFFTLEEYKRQFNEFLETSNLARFCTALGDTPEMKVRRFLPDNKRLTDLKKSLKGDNMIVQDVGLDSIESARKKAYELRLKQVKEGRKMFTTKSMLLGMGPISVQEGDEIWVLLGAKVPFVLRPGDGKSCHTLVGEAYVHGYMDGSVLEQGAELQVVALE